MARLAPPSIIVVDNAPALAPELCTEGTEVVPSAMAISGGADGIGSRGCGEGDTRSTDPFGIAGLEDVRFGGDADAGDPGTGT